MRKRPVGLALSLAVALTLSPDTSIYASSTSNVDNSTTIINNENINDTTEDKSVRVKADLDSTYSVKIPKKIVMDGSNKEAEYEVSVNASSDIAGYEAILAKPETETMSLSSDNKGSVTMSINQSKQTWSYNEFGTEKATKGTITEATGEKLTAGSWSGTFNFKVMLINTLIGGNCKRR